MVHWFWLLIAAQVGFIGGVLAVSLMNAAAWANADSCGQHEADCCKAPDVA